MIGITQPAPKEDAWSGVFSNLYKSGPENYVGKHYKDSFGGGFVIPITVSCINMCEVEFS